MVAAAMMGRGPGAPLEHVHHGHLGASATHVGDPSHVGHHGLVGHQTADINELLQQILNITDSSLDEAQARYVLFYYWSGFEPMPSGRFSMSFDQ